METESLDLRPRRAAIAREQLLATGLALRPGALVITALLALVTALVLWAWLEDVRQGRHPGGVYVATGTGVPAALLGLIVPLSVWKNEDPGRRAYLWSLPVGRTEHQLLKSAAGWLWFMTAVASYVLWTVALWAITSGSAPIAQVAVPDGARLALVERPIPAWQWAVPFVAATATYLLGTALALATHFPWRWLAALGIGYVLTAAVLSGLGLDEAQAAWRSLLDGRFGLRTLFTGKAVAADALRGAAGETPAYRYPRPDRQAWLASAALWTSATTAAAVAAALWRREA